MKVNDVFTFLNELFPCNTALPYDNPGILAGDSNSEVKKALVALDCNFDIIDIAKENGCNLIITHHPVIFDGLKSVTEESVIYSLIKNGISVISMHTNLDMGKNGVNDALCRRLGLSEIKEITDDEGFVLRRGFISPHTCDTLAQHIKECLGGSVKYNTVAKDISNILVCSGSGGSYLSLAKSLNCDALITADVKHSVFVSAQNLGIAVFDAGHFDTEDVMVEPLCKMLSDKFNGIEFIPCHFSRIRCI